MTEATGASLPSESRCPWCSAPAPQDAERCPSCGAALREVAPGQADEIPGVTAIDPVLHSRRQVPRPNRLVGWLADLDTEPERTIGLTPGQTSVTGGAQGLDAAGQASVAPPSEDVKREMARLELEALKAELEARAAEAQVLALEAAEVSAPAAPPAAEASPATGPADDVTATGDADTKASRPATRPRRPRGRKTQPRG